MSHLSPGIHNNVWQCLLQWYTHGRYQWYQSILIPLSLNVSCSSLIWGSTYKAHRWRFNTVTGLYASIFSFLNRTNGCWSSPSFTIAECADKDTSVGVLYTSLFLHNYVALLYHDRMSHSYIILAGHCHIKNWYCTILHIHLCTTWVTLASASNNFWSQLKTDSTVNSYPHKYFLYFPFPHRTVSASPTKLCIGFSSGNTVDLEMKKIGHRCIPHRDLSN